MAMIFPGMDPYLEHPVLWPGLHMSMIVGIMAHLQPLVRPKYVAAIEERVYVEPLTKDIVRQSYIAILDLRHKQRVVAVIELVSPSNKYEGEGRKSYVDKQREIRNSNTHLVEIDLLRLGPHVLAVSEQMVKSQGAYRYLACVNRAIAKREDFELYPRMLADRLPRIGVPLAGADKDVVLDVRAVLEETYENAAYIDRIDYEAPCLPRLSTKDQAWANRLIHKAMNR